MIDDEPEALIVNPPYQLTSSAPFKKDARKMEAIADAYIQKLVRRGLTTYCRPYIGPAWSDFTDKEIGLLNRQLDRMWLMAWLDGKPDEYGNPPTYQPQR